MKNTVVLFCILSILLLTGYDPVYDYAPVNYRPVLLEREVLENSLRFESAEEILNPGKIYVYGNYLMLNEKYKGIHVFDNSNPESPENIGFIRIPGCIDIAVKDSVLFADNAVDLIAVDISDVNNPVVTKRIVEVFPELKPPGQDWLPYIYEKQNRPEETVIIEWIEE